MNLKEIFIDKLANRPYCTDDLNYGLTIRDKLVAKEKKYIQANQPFLINWLCFDIDYPCILETTFKEKCLPSPNFMIINPDNMHSHLLYGLVTGVSCSDNSYIKPLNYLSAIEYSLREELKADNSYSGLIIKNPCHNLWETYELEKELWTLPQLEEYLTLPKKLPGKAKFLGLGRNCTLFELGRKYAYEQVFAFKTLLDKESFSKDVLYYIETNNRNFPEPLHFNECKSIAKSISNWTWKNYRKKINDEEWKEYVKITHTSEIQSKRGKRSGQVRFKGSIEEKQPWKDLGISRAWYFKQKKNGKLVDCNL